MNQHKVTEKIINLAIHALKIKIGVNSLKASLVLDLGADSLKIVELIMAVEEEFSVQFPDSLTPKLNTLQDIIDNTIRLLAASNPKN